MRTAPITKGGQVSLPAEVRHRWGTSRVAILDEGDRVVLTPVPDDPIAATRGILARPGQRPLAEVMTEVDAGTAAAEARRYS
jgi:bifunctional DNA-binding transcriptional regulator/antitoxin component of YhaV-PrlF toxin-antitoxin module